ncbi:MutS-related protein [Enterococcus timonensis]|uniref:MutS-related protein n=1 Tax=Enterococcus timonensis TaxID=1852364 RepID=UPI0008D8E62B|nr:DNA mismatch repair protein MutS [Enterococcus timonensis]
MSQEQLFIGGVVLFVIALLLFIKVNGDIQLKKSVRNAQGKFPRVVAGRDTEKSLKEAFKQSSTGENQVEIDDLTWNDLDMFTVFQMINQTFSSIGSENLYQRMRKYGLDQDFSQLEELITFLSEHPKEKEDLQWAFAKLGKKDYNAVQSYLKEPKKQQLGNPWSFLFLGILPIIGLIMLFFNALGLLVLIFSVPFNVVFYFRKKNQMETELLSMGYLVQTILCGKNMKKITQPTQEKIKENLRPLEKITRFAFSFSVKTNTDGDLFMEYFNMIFLLPFISYNFVLGILQNHQKEAQALWQLLGDLEAASAILNFREIMPYATQPTFQKELQVHAKDVYHPLLKEPVVNDIDWTKNTLITGSNASGKSTYVKGVAINCLLAQTIHTTLAEQFSLPHSLVISSMALEDNIFAGESYFIAEIKSVKRIIDHVKKGVPTLCFIDEILKGTNTIERIAASSSIVAWLADHGALSFVATHDIELTEILKKQCANVHFSESVNKKGVFFDYKLKDGPAKTRNALALLKVLKYPAEIVTAAQNEASSFEEQRAWREID